ncbi:AhpC/TSA family protein [Pseudoalteromonas sp. SWXJ133]|uniref:peroxiredoxin-like family protein n=1 Tax=unclassified Pseudoalteromonas TaxID=194690 RepID=UPI0014094F7A|nr:MULTISPECIES: peroxiredoxin-like family protein [unclassified Pseudoalteromonas]MBH0021165.1 AhpC/TSA family protein [Pseudoalteromonas sp. SWXJ133]
MTVSVLQAGQVFPNISISKYGGGTLNIATPVDGFDWKMIIVYRGKHCPLCTRYLQELKQALPEFNLLGVDVIAISADSAERTAIQMSEVNPNFEVGYDLTIEQMKQLGLYISGPRNGMNVERAFAEPGLFVINEEGCLQMVDVSNVPFARPPIASMLMGLKYYRNMTDKFPINGSYN